MPAGPSEQPSRGKCGASETSAGIAVDDDRLRTQGQRVIQECTRCHDEVDPVVGSIDDSDTGAT